MSVKQEKTGQKSPLSIPSKWRERFVIKRIKEEDIFISLETRNAILSAMEKGQNFVQVGKYTLMINSISSINPYWEPDNIPPCPDRRYSKERALWSRCFGKKLLED